MTSPRTGKARSGERAARRAASLQSALAAAQASALPQTGDGHEHELITGEAVALDLRPTGFALRVAGAAIDFVTYLGGGILLLLFVLPLLADWLRPDEATQAAWTVALLVVVTVVLPTAVELATHGKSLGRLAVGARIVRDDGGAVGFRHTFVRSLTGILEIYLTLGGLAVLVALLNGKSKRMGDLLAGTYSQYERVSKEVVPVYGVPQSLVPWAQTADVARMPDRLARRVSQFLRQADKFTPATRRRLAGELAAEASISVYPVPRTEPELMLAALAAIRREREFTALTLERERLTHLEPALRGLPHGFPDRG
ncbi:RDD family protein [Glaciihabitans sp. dw_435]|uniref:RDD family protein n=1 Tax=Glaciihabitans sp. dw_435 TaxID=2720081 RepID=UPI001BD274E5|nr:RDD family protein [Glaciihabitans sp. dw_435]